MLHLLSRLSITEKLLLSGAGLLIPLLIFLYGYVDSARQAIEKTRSEMQAVEPLSQLANTFKAIYLYESLGSGVRTNTDNQEISGALNEVRTSVDKLSALATGELAASVAKLSNNWSAMSSIYESDTGLARAKARRQVASSVVLVARNIGDQYNLAADSNLDSYYLAVLAAFQLPQTIAILWDSALISRDLQAEQTPVAGLIALAAAAGSLQNGLVRDAENSADIALRLDKSYNGVSISLQSNLPKLRDSFIPTATGCEQQAWQAATQQTETNMRAVFHSCAAAAGAGLDLWADSIRELRILQQQRIEDLTRSYRTHLVFSSLGLAFALGLVLTVSRYTRRTLGMGIEIARLVAQGHIQTANRQLTSSSVELLIKELPPDSTIRDESFVLLLVMHRMISRLEDVRRRLNQANPAVADAVVQLREAVRNLDETVSGQAETTARVSANAQRISSVTEASGRAMEAVTRIATASASAASDGQEYLVRIRDAMAQLGQASQGLLETFGKVKDRTIEVDEVITTITKIANRTNLISLNAAIEAEKSGDTTSGFSVIAEEIQRLAEQTAVAGHQIEHLIREARAAVETGSETLGRYASQAQSSQASIEEVSGELKQVMEGVQLFGPEFETVNQGMHAQSHASRDITQSVSNLNTAAKRTAGAMTQCEAVLMQLEVALEEVRSGIVSLASGD
jgi:methyl-accepting chemotaxis protein